VKASTDSAGMTDADLAHAVSYHDALADSYRRKAERADHPAVREASARLADRHRQAADECRAEIEQRGFAV